MTESNIPPLNSQDLKIIIALLDLYEKFVGLAGGAVQVVDKDAYLNSVDIKISFYNLEVTIGYGPDGVPSVLGVEA